MKVLLAKPYNLSDHIQPSLGLGYLAACARKSHNVKILDCIKERVNIDKLGPLLKSYNPDVFGLQCYTFDLKFIKSALKLAKDIKKDITTVVGGPHPSAAPEEMMRSNKPDLDFLFAGEAEIGFPLFLDSLNSGRRDFHSIPGLTWREGEEIRSNPKIVVEDLDSIGMPAWDMIHPEDYPESQHGAFFKKFPIAPIMITRGCPYQCTFCAGKLVSGTGLRKRSISTVLREINILYKDYGIR